MCQTQFWVIQSFLLRGKKTMKVVNNESHSMVEGARCSEKCNKQRRVRGKGGSAEVTATSVRGQFLHPEFPSHPSWKRCHLLPEVSLMPKSGQYSWWSSCGACDLSPEGHSHLHWMLRGQEPGPSCMKVPALAPSSGLAYSRCSSTGWENGWMEEGAP